MRDFIGLEHTTDESYARRTDHRFHALGCPMSPEMFAPMRRAAEERRRMGRNQPWATQCDTAWVVCLHEAGVIDLEKTSRLLKALHATRDSDAGVSGEERLVNQLDGNMDLASIVNYGRTLQEPMSRLKLRDKLLDVFRDTLDLLSVIHRRAMENLDTIMVGHTHMNHGQPMTYAHFMLSAFDGMFRGLEQLELAYRFTNLNSGGCGSCSGTTWPVDRERMAELLGMDGVLEPTYDSEASQDHSMAVMFALSHLSIHLTRHAMMHYIWAMDELDMIRTHPSMCGVSSFMPQKCDSGSNYERVRISACDVMGETVKSMLQLKAEPHGDVIIAMQLPAYAIEAMIHAQASMQQFGNLLEHALLQKDRMLAIVRAGYSCATEVATHLIREGGYGGRMAHSITATMVRLARERGLKSGECTGELLDEAARYLGSREPHMDTATLQRCLDPEAFIRTHNHLGGTAPDANRKLLEKRAVRLKEAEARHAERAARVAAATQQLAAMAANGSPECRE